MCSRTKLKRKFSKDLFAKFVCETEFRSSKTTTAKVSFEPGISAEWTRGSDLRMSESPPVHAGCFAQWVLIHFILPEAKMTKCSLCLFTCMHNRGFTCAEVDKDLVQVSRCCQRTSGKSAFTCIRVALCRGDNHSWVVPTGKPVIIALEASILMLKNPMLSQVVQELDVCE